MNGELVFVRCIQGCETYLDADEFYTHKMTEDDMRCSEHGEPYQPAINSTED